MKRTIAFLLLAVLLAAAVSAGAEYRGWNAVMGEPLNGARHYYPLDAHNAVIYYRPYDETTPWHVTWHRDGKVYRDLEGPCGDRHDLEWRVPKPFSWDGETLTVTYRVRQTEQYQRRMDVDAPDPDNYTVMIADWTASGLTNARAVEENWSGLFEGGRTVVYRRETGAVIRRDGKETAVPDSIPAGTMFLDCCPAGEDAFLLKFRGDDGKAYVVRAENGREIYRAEVPVSETYTGDEAVSFRLFSADRAGGFIRQEGFNHGDYSPVYLVHYNAAGKEDRTLVLKGDDVCLSLLRAAQDQEGLLTVYGSMVSNSRKIYTVFALTFDDDLNLLRRDVRKIDPEYGDYSPGIFLAQDGTPWAKIEEVNGEGGGWLGLCPVLIPFDKLEKTDKTYGLKVLQYNQ